MVKKILESRRPRFNPGLGRSTGEGNGNPLEYSCLENHMDGGAWQSTVQNKLSRSSMAHTLLLNTRGIHGALWLDMVNHFAVTLCKTGQKSHAVINFALCHSHCNLCDHLGDSTVKTPLGCALPRGFTNHKDCCAQPFLTTFGPRDSSGSLLSCSSQCLVVQYSVFCLLVHASGVPLIGTPSLWSPYCLSQEVKSCGSPSSSGG